MLVIVACVECLKHRQQASVHVVMLDELPNTIEMYCEFHHKVEAYPIQAVPNVSTPGT